MNKLHQLGLERNSTIFELKAMRKEGAWPVHIGQIKKKLAQIETEIEKLKNEQS